MDITTLESTSIPVATITGDIDGKTAPQAQSYLLGLVGKNPRLVIDMTRVGFLSSAGLRIMLLLYRQAAAKNGKIVLVGLSEEIKDTMSMTGFLNFFALAGSVEEGTRLLAEG
jgi:anti-sigma B factor antagonist